MTPEGVRGILLGAAAAGVAGACGFAWLAHAQRRSGSIAPVALLQAIALRFGLTLVAAIALAVGLGRAAAAPALLALGATYLALLAVETRWATRRGAVGR